MADAGVGAARPQHYIDVPEAVGVFGSWAMLQETMYDLLVAGFSRFDISVLANEEAVREKLKDRFWSAKELEDDPDVPRSAFVSEEAIGELEGGITGGFVFPRIGDRHGRPPDAGGDGRASIAAAVVGGVPGAVIGGVLARRVGAKHKDYYQNQIERGGILLWVRCSTSEKERLAQEIMAGHSGQDVHLHRWSEA